MQERDQVKLHTYVASCWGQCYANPFTYLLNFTGQRKRYVANDTENHESGKNQTESKGIKKRHTQTMKRYFVGNHRAEFSVILCITNRDLTILKHEISRNVLISDDFCLKSLLVLHKEDLIKICMNLFPWCFFFLKKEKKSIYNYCTSIKLLIKRNSLTQLFFLSFFLITVIFQRDYRPDRI